MSSPYAYAPAPPPAAERAVYACRPNHRSSAQPAPIIKHAAHCDCDDCYHARRRGTHRSRSRVRFGGEKRYRNETAEERAVRDAHEARHGRAGYRDACEDARRGRNTDRQLVRADPNHRPTRHHSSDAREHKGYRSSSPAVGPAVLDMRDPRWKNPRPQPLALPPAPGLAPSYSVGPGVVYAPPPSPYAQQYGSPQRYPPMSPTGQFAPAPPNVAYATPMMSPVAVGFAVGPPVQYVPAPYAGYPPPGTDSRRFGQPNAGYAAADYGGSDSE
ncbi:hypothetical protein PsYK624_030880 [Phanerochaete sordida]|uniref:Uncharacterized protein n=1 Tax=Phanerochaete sordida TaxID=48140 RepID=A0A9P3G346_9APHY|nr:hypothetical protein PsYK624_030880 [Phanerochaete sordida]